VLVLIKQLVVLHQLLLLLMQQRVVTGQVVPEHLLRIEMLLMQLYTPAAGEIGTTITLTWNVPDPMVLVLVLLQLDQMNITINTATVASAGADQTTCGASSNYSCC
jgi:hypothetical protein